MRENDCPQLPHQLPPDTMLQDRYRLIRVLGEGGFGITYEGWDETLCVRVAVKEFFPKAIVTRHQRESHDITIPSGEPMALFEKGKASFLNEARTLAQFQRDANIVSVTNFFEENQTAYIVMEYLEGQDLKVLLEQRGTLSFSETLRLLSPVMEALSMLHAKGVIHRDVSPSNIRILPNGETKLMDFGASRTIDTTSVDESRSICLKPGYSPEEQYRSRGELGPWTDVYALSATMYHMLVGFPPDDSLQRILLDEVKKPSELGADVPEGADDVLMRGLAVLRRDRFQSMQAFRDALYTCLSNGPAVSEPEPQKSGPESEPEPESVQEPEPKPKDNLPVRSKRTPADRLPLQALIPVTGLMCLFEMERRTGRDRYKRAGRLFVILNLIAALLYLLSRLYYMQTAVPAAVMEIALIALLFTLYFTRAIYALSALKDYQRFRSAYLMKHPKTDSIPQDPDAKKGVFVWRVIGFIPFIAGFSGIHVGRKDGVKSLRLFGIFLQVFLFFILLTLVQNSLTYMYMLDYSEMNVASSIIREILALSIRSAIALFLLLLTRLTYAFPGFSDGEIRLRAEALREYPNLRDPKWRAENARWQIWTFLPLVGGIGLLFAGRRAKRRDLTKKGVLLLVLSAVALLTFVVLSTVSRSIAYSWIRAPYELMLPVAEFALAQLWIVGMFAGASARFSVLHAIAKDLGPYYSRAEKEIAQLEAQQ